MGLSPSVVLPRDMRGCRRVDAEPKTQVTSAVVPRIGDVVDTIYGRQQVMDVLDLAYGERAMFFRPEHGGREWCVDIGQLERVLLERAER